MWLMRDFLGARSLKPAGGVGNLEANSRPSDVGADVSNVVRDHGHHRYRGRRVTIDEKVSTKLSTDRKGQANIIGYARPYSRVE
jgi:hypothetical protein